MNVDKVKLLLDKVNLLFNVFMKDGIEKISPLEKALLKEQIQLLLKALEDEGTEITKHQAVQEIEHVIEEKEAVEQVEEKIESSNEEIKIAQVEEKFQLIKEDNSNHIESSEEKTYSDATPTRSLNQIIDLNKSFILKADLFANNQIAYQNFIQQLNTLQSEKTSFEFVEKTANEKQWDKEEKAYELLLRAVEKRFLPLIQ